MSCTPHLPLLEMPTAIDYEATLITLEQVELTALLIKELHSSANVTIIGPADISQRSPVVSVTVEDYIPEQLAMVLSEVFDIATRAGLHCAPQAHRVAGTIDIGALCFSPGVFNTEDEICEAAAALMSIL